MTLWLGVGLVIVLFAALGFGEQRDDLFVLENHHGYYGAMLWGIGEWRGWWWLIALGLVLLADDAGQHAYQRWANRPMYRSPLHRLYGATLWQWKWVRHVNRWLDGR